MLKSLYVKNYALIEEVTVEFANGLNILTGETGAGKSIIIGALGLLLGERASTESVRQGSDKAVVEGTYAIADNQPVCTILVDNGYEAGDELIIRREITAKGGSRTFLNDSPAPLTLLKEIGNHLVDLHGQHDHQMLLRTETHIHMLDNAGGLEQLVTDYAIAYSELSQMQSELQQFRKREAQLREKLEFHQFQLAEIDETDPQEGEDTALENDLRVLENSEQIVELTTSLNALLYEDEGSVRDQLVRARNMLDRLAQYDTSLAEQRSEIASACVIVEEITKSLQSYSAGIEFAPEKLETMRERLLKLSGLRKKYGGTLQAVLEYRHEIADEIELAEHYDERIATLQAALEMQRERTGQLAARLSQKRKTIATKVEQGVLNTLKQLGIEKGIFRVVIAQQPLPATQPGAVIHSGTYYAANETGFDTVEFYMSTNLGEEPKPLARVASGGEISRVMLALKTILAKNDRLPMLVFDEIDTGISGRIGTKVGAAMRNLAEYHQIIAITHLPQIAAMSSNHYVVEKVEKEGRTTTTIRKLNENDHTREVAKLMSGEVITESSLQMARELIEA